jgi:lipid A disaccharide synthetase
VNVVAGRLVAPEFIQHDLQPMKVADTLESLLDHASPIRQAMIIELERVRGSLGEAGAAARVAAIALSLASGAPRARAS